MFKLWSGEDRKEQSTTMSMDKAQESSVTSRDDQATEALAKIMRIFGRHSFELDSMGVGEIEKEFERWAMHVLVGTPVVEDEEAPNDGRRNWGELNRFVNTHRQHEKQYVTDSMGDLRDVLLTFTQTVVQAVVEDKETDRQMVKHIDELQVAAATSSVTEMKKALLSAVHGIGQAMEERKVRQKTQVETLGSKLQKVQAELGQARKQMELDPLTQLYNRAALDTQLERIVSLSMLSGSAASLFMIDIDHFKRVNDTYGHRAGDAVLQQFAERMVSIFLRKSDFLARYGGEEMAVLLQGDGLEVSQRIASRLLEAIRSRPFIHEGTEISVTASIGLAELIPGEPPGAWVERADRALYQAKETGRDRLCLASGTVVV
ncbi:MAG: GGDEF domain-containing protein [Nitrospirales bacterium]|nr:GGDEF domain-containing protein [Nitrospira sp.]MDR4501503.1 GGDEF domain-containing protein [Nitrospirales bacterium]